MPTLHVLSGEVGAKAFELTEDRVTIGRAPDNSVMLKHTTVSKSHAMLVKNGDGYKLFDFHSTNGTFVNDERIAVTTLHGGDRLRLGDIELRYEVNVPKSSALAEPTQQLPVLAPVQERKSNPPPAKPPELEKEVPAAPPIQVLGASTRTDTPESLPKRDSNKPPAAPAPLVPAGPRSSGDTKNFDAGTVILNITPSKPVQGTAPDEKPLVSIPPKAIKEEFRLKPPENRTPAEPKKDAVPATKPAVVSSQPAPVQRGSPVAPAAQPSSKKRRSVFAACLVIGLLLLFAGYAVQAPCFKFVGLLMTIAGVLCLVFDLKFGCLLAAPRGKQ